MKATRNKINRHINQFVKDGQVDKQMANLMRQVSKGVKWRYDRNNEMRVVTAIDKTTGLEITTNSSEISYQESQMQAVYDMADRARTKNSSGVMNVNPYFLPKHVASHPQPVTRLVPPKNPRLISVVNEVFDDHAKQEAAKYAWGTESGNYYGVRELNMQGAAIPSFIAQEDWAEVEETDEEFDFFGCNSGEEETAYVCGYLASNYKNTFDDDGDIKLFAIPRTITDPGFKINLSTIDPPDGSTHDLNLNPENGENKAQDRKDVMHQMANYLYDKCMNMAKHYSRHVTMSGHKPTMQEAVDLVVSAMKSDKDNVCIFTTFKAFPKMEPMSMEKIVVHAAMRMIWGPGGVEAILGKLLLKNITLCSFKRFERGNAHAVEAKDGGFNRMFIGMMENSANRERYLKIAAEIGMDPDDFEDLLEHFGWRDDDIQKWDIMQYQSYMNLNFFYFIFQYKWSEKLDVDEVNWLYLLITLAIIDTTVVSNMGHGIEIFKRILASGLFLTASGGSKTHDTFSHAYAFRQTLVAIEVHERIKARRDEIPKADYKYLSRSFAAFMNGTPFVHFSDDFLQCALREGLPFGQLVNRNAYFSRNYDLSFKVNKRDWDSTVGVPELEAMMSLMSKCPTIFKGVKDIYNVITQMEPMNGVIKEFELIPYKDRVKMWYPLTSEINSDRSFDPSKPEGIVIKGISFLRFHFVREIYEGMQFVMPIRDESELYHKLYLSNVEYKNDAQILIKLRMYQYYMYRWPKARELFKKVHDVIFERSYTDIAAQKDDFYLSRELPRKLGISFDELLAGYPTIEQVILFYKPKTMISSAATTDPRARILTSKYRAEDFVCWDIIRVKDYADDIPGVYARPFGEAAKARYLEKLKSEGRTHRPTGPKFSLKGKMPPSWKGAKGPRIKA